MIAPAPLSVSGLSVDLAQGRAALRDVGFRVEPFFHREQATQIRVIEHVKPRIVRCRLPHRVF